MEELKACRPTLIGLVIGFTLGVLAVRTDPLFIFQRIGEGFVMAAALVIGFWLAVNILEYGMRALGIYKDFLGYMQHKWVKRGRPCR